MGEVLTHASLLRMGPPKAQRAQDAREARVYEAIDAIDLPGLCLSYAVEKIGCDSPNLNALQQTVDHWARVSAPELNLASFVEQTFEFGLGWVIRLRLYRDHNLDRFGRSIAIASLRPHWVGQREAAEPLRRALEAKAKRYDDGLGGPYVLAILDNTGQSGFLSDMFPLTLADALFGSTRSQVIGGSDRIVESRGPDGFWRQSNAGVRNSHVSAVLAFPDMYPWYFRRPERQPLLAINPEAKWPLEMSVWPFRCVSAWNRGSDSHSVQVECQDVFGITRRARSRSSRARPYIVSGALWPLLWAWCSGRGCWLPMPGHELVDAVLRPAVDETGQQVGEIALRVHTVELAGLDEGGDRGPVCAAFVAAGE